MNRQTDDLIRRLARDVGAGAARRPSVRIRLAGGAGACVPLLIGLVYLLFGWRADLVPALSIDAVLLKLVIGAGLAAAGILIACRLAEPGRHRMPTVGMLAGAAMAAPFAWLLSRPDPAGTMSTQAGDGAICMAIIFGLALLPMALLLRLARSGAPTRPGLAGMAIGLASGAMAAFAYAFACPMETAGFVVTWYVAAIGLAAALGALAGRRMLAW
ncbi:MAG: NrsF family protein [Sneathiellaceae bacterium]